MDRRIADLPPHRGAAPGSRGAPITIEFEKQTYRAYEGEPVAVALHAAGVRVLSRSIKYHRPRTFFCLSGHCNGCLVRADGVPNLRGCMTACKDGMELTGQNAFPSSDLDLLGAVDWLFPKGMDHHRLMTGSRVLHGVMQKVVRQLSGLGVAPDRVAESLPEVEERQVDVLVVGGGPAGLAAATASARAGARTLLVDEQARPGGSLLADPRFGPAEAARRADAARAAGVDLRTESALLAWFPEDDGGLAAVASPDHLIRVKARRYLYATGGYDANALFEDNDRPGVFSSRAVGRLVVQWGVKPGAQVVVLGGSDYARALAEELARLGLLAARVDGTRTRAVRARGRAWVSALEVEDEQGKRRRLACDAVAVDTLPSPASEAPRQHGAAVQLDAARGGFAVVVDEAGHTSVADVLACGDVTGFLGPERAAEHGARVGALAAQEAIRA